MNINGLDAGINQIYQTFTGPPLAYFELPIDSLEGQYLRVVYKSVNTAMVGGADQNEATLCGWFYSKLKEKLTVEQRQDHGVFLIWRSKPQLVEFTNHAGQICTAIRARLAIPGIDLYDVVCAEGAQPRFL